MAPIEQNIFYSFAEFVSRMFFPSALTLYMNFTHESYVSLSVFTVTNADALGIVTNSRNIPLFIILFYLILYLSFFCGEQLADSFSCSLHVFVPLDQEDEVKSYYIYLPYKRNIYSEPKFVIFADNFFSIKFFVYSDMRSILHYLAYGPFIVKYLPQFSQW